MPLASGQNGFAQIFLVLILLVGLGIGVYLVQQKVLFHSHASSNQTRIEVHGAGVTGSVATQRSVLLTLIYIPTKAHPSAFIYPDYFKLSDNLVDLAKAEKVAFRPNLDVPWQLSSGDGKKTIYAQFQVNGLWETPISVMITLKQKASGKNTSDSRQFVTATVSPIIFTSRPYSSAILAQPTLNPIAANPYYGQPSPSPLAQFLLSGEYANSTQPACDFLLTLIQNSLQKSCGDQEYDFRADLNKDKTINQLDLDLLSRKQESWCEKQIQSIGNICPKPSTSFDLNLPTEYASPADAQSKNPLIKVLDFLGNVISVQKN